MMATSARSADFSRDTVAPATAGMTEAAVRAWLRLEGAAAFAAGLALFAATGGNWLFLIPLLLLPDVSAIGYLAGPRLGAITYNAVHNWVPGIVVLGLGIWLSSPALLIA